MNKDQAKGKMNDIKGRAERQVSEWTGDEEGQVKGTADQIKGKAQKVLGDVKEGVERAREDIHDESVRSDQRRRDKDENAA